MIKLLHSHKSNGRAEARYRHKYKPIENYGVVGNLHTVALVGMNGSIDWCCLPHFDSPSIFGALLDADKGGYFKIAPTAPSTPKQVYLPDSNILLSRFLSPDGVGEVMDFMPLEDDPKEDENDHHVYRVAHCVRGTVEFKIECFPAFVYGTVRHQIELRDPCVVFKSDQINFALHTPIRLTRSKNGVVGTFTLKEGESAAFVLRHLEQGGIDEVCAYPLNPQEAFDRTLAYWHRWAGRIQYEGRWREMVTRSALTLKLLTYAPSGAIVAAPTTSLPELIGGKRNWDYRYSWIRDSSFTLYGLLRLGYSEEARDFMGWLEERLKDLNPDGSLNLMYGLHGQKDLKERELKHWEGYMGSKPVRIGNGAYQQLQLDIYGELMDSVYLYNKYGSPISYDLWVHLRRLLDYVCKHWQEPDRGIWEVRTGPQHFIYSKVMCWVAIDRGIRLAQKRSLPADWELWTQTRDAIYEEVMQRGWDPHLKSFVQHYGAKTVDASALMLPLVKFVSPTDPRMLGTLARIKERLVSDSLVQRYELDERNPISRMGNEGTFSMCTFWYVEALARAGFVQEARWNFEKMLGYANHLGLYSEELSPAGHLLGNFPQAFTHLGLISAAYNLDKALQAKNPQLSQKSYVFFPKQNGGPGRPAEAEEKAPPIGAHPRATRNGHSSGLSSASPRRRRK